jgi:DNA-binding CsgD family transcriptional regulator
MSATAVLDAIGAIYDAVLDPLQWPRALRHLSCAGTSVASSIVVNDIHGREPSRVFEHGLDQSHLRLYFEKLAVMQLASGAPRRLRTEGDIATLTMLCGECERTEHDFYARWVRPLGFRDMVGVLVLRSGKRLAWFSLARSEIQERYSEDDLRQLELVSPHMCRAFRIADALELRTIAQQRLEQTIDSLSTGIILTEQSGRISYMNRSAEDLIRAGKSLRMCSGQLVAARPRAAKAFERALGECLRGEAPERTGTHAISLPGEDGHAVLLNILPLQWRSDRNPFAPLPGAAAVIVQNPTETAHEPGRALAKLYGLTPAEARILDELTRGHSLAEIAFKLALSLATVKTHLQHIFGKTGTSRQAELVGLALRAVPPLRNGGARE